MISSSVLALHTGQTIYGLRSVGSRHILRFPFGFLTMTKEFSHSGAFLLASSNLVKMPCDTMLSSSLLNCSLKGLRYSPKWLLDCHCIFGKCDMNWVTFEPTCTFNLVFVSWMFHYPFFCEGFRDITHWSFTVSFR